MSNRAAAKLNMRLAFSEIPSDDQLAMLKQQLEAMGATVKAADLTYSTPTKVSLK